MTVHDAALRATLRRLVPDGASVWTAPAGRLARGHEWACVVFDPVAGTVRQWSDRTEARALLRAVEALGE